MGLSNSKNIQHLKIIINIIYYMNELNWIVFVVRLTNQMCLALYPTGNIFRDPHHRESPTRRKQGSNLRRNWVQAFLNEVVHYCQLLHDMVK